MQMQLLHESITDALRECVHALGGAKVVGAALKPELAADAAGQWVRDCLNPERRERFTPDQVLWLLREARKANCHAGMAFLAQQCGYADPVPVEPEDERAALMRQFVAAQQSIQQLVTRMERVGLVKVAA